MYAQSSAIATSSWIKAKKISTVKRQPEEGWHVSTSVGLSLYGRKKEAALYTKKQ